MDRASSERGEEEAPPLLSGTADSNIEWPKVVNASVREREETGKQVSP